MRKKLIALLLIAVLVVQVVGCQSKSGGKDGSEGTNTDVAGTLTDGTYLSEQQGHNGPIKYEVTISDGKIEKIEVVKSYETVGVADKALFTDLPNEIIEKQAANVDAITGATISSLATMRAVEDVIAQAGGDVKDFKLEKAETTPEEIEKTADIVIVGGGGAGLAAATAASESGASVIVLEKAGYLGGNTLVAGGIYNSPDEELQRKEKMELGHIALWEDAINEPAVSEEHKELQAKIKSQLEEYKASGENYLLDTKEWFALQTWNGGDKIANLDLVKSLANNAFDAMKWLEGMGWEYEDFITTGAGSMYPRTHKSIKPLGVGMIEAYTDTLDTRDNVEIILNTEVTDLITDGDKVVGAKGTDKHGNTYIVNANNYVILTTGGFGGNLEMVEEYNTSGKWPELSNRNSTNLPTINGDGIKLAIDVGASVRDMEQIQLLFTCEPKTGQVNPGNFKPKGTEGYIFINQEGKRFVREDGRRDEISLAMLAQTDELGYMVQSADSGIDLETTTDIGGVPIKDNIETGLVFYGETLEEAAEKAGIPADALQATIDEYNQLVENNAERDELGRAVFTTKLENGPWYIVPRSPAIHHTMGGLVIDEDCHVLNAQGEKIPGLLAAGEIVGGIHGGNRLGGNAIVDTVVFGKRAGETAIK